MSVGRYLDAAEVERMLPGFLADLETRGVEISNNAGAIIVDGYLGDLLDALAGALERRASG